jgi:hypothetical protein
MAVDLNNIQTGYLGQEGVFKIEAMNINEVAEQEREATRKFFNESEDRAILADGTLVFLDKDGSTQYVPQSKSEAEIDKSMIDESVVKDLADLKYLAQNVGASTAKMNAAYEKLGLDTSKSTVFSDADAILRSYGYKPGQQGSSFWGSNTSDDTSVNILVSRWDSKPSDEDLKAAGIDPSSVSIVNDHAANAAYLAEQLIKQGVSLDSTKAPVSRLASASRAARAESNRQVEDLLKNKAPGSYWDKKMSETGLSLDELQLDMLEWDLIKKKAEEKSADKTPKVGATGITTGGAETGTPGGSISGGFTTDPNTLDIPSSAVIPTLSTSQITPGASGTYTTPAQTFEQNLTNQATDFQNRAVTNQQFVNPQTASEKVAAGQDVSSYAISQKLYRNPQTGHQMFIAFQGSQPLAPIPAGYYEINQQTGTFGQENVFNPITAGGNTFTTQAVSANSGGYIQGFSGEDGSTTIPNPSPIDPNQIYGDVSFQDPVTGETITQTPEEYFQSLGNKVAQTTFNPATAVTMPGVSTMAELGYQYDADGNVMMDPETGQPMYQELMPGTVIESTAGQASGMAPIVGKYQQRDASGNLMFDAAGQPIMVGTDPAQVTDVVQAKGPGYPGLSADDYSKMALQVSTGVLPYDPRFDTNGDGTVTSADALAIARGEFVVTPTPEEAPVQAPGAAQAGLTTAAPGVSAQLQGGTTTDYAGMAATVPGAVWDVATGTFKVGDQTFTPDQFIAANGINVGNFMTTTGGLQAATMDDLTKTVDAATMQKQMIDPVTGQPMFDAQGNPIMESDTSVSGLSAATGSATRVADAQGADGSVPVRTLDTTEGQSELISGSAVDQGEVGKAFGTGEVQAASVQDELTGLMAQFEGGETPAWASGAMRKATAMLAARGLGASSMAGQAVIQAAMEAALPIAQIDAGNKQQMALFKAEQRSKFLGMEFDQAFQAKVMNAARISEIANMNFTAEQEIALENSRAANTMNLQNLSNKQALIMAEAAALSQMDIANLNNLQQAQVQNAQNFLQLDLANLNNSQSTALFKAQQVTNAMLSDVAQANATAQFNATSENQTNQFFSNLAAQVSQFNAAQQNAINQFNAEEVNALLEFNSALQNQREMFNAQNYLVVAQANAQWRQNINTANTEAQNVANLTYAKEVNGLTQKALDDYWQKERDIMSYAFAQSEGAADRAIRIMLGNMDLDALRTKLDFAEDNAKAEFWSDLIFGDMSFSDVFKLPKKEEDK